MSHSTISPITLRNGRVFDTPEDLQLYYLDNLHRGALPVAGYFCLDHGHEMLNPRFPCECNTHPSPFYSTDPGDVPPINNGPTRIIG